MLDKLLPFIKEIADRYGVRSIVTTLSCYGLYHMAELKMLEGTYAAGGIVIITLGYFVGRHLELKTKKETNGNSKTSNSIGFEPTKKGDV